EFSCGPVLPASATGAANCAEGDHGEPRSGRATHSPLHSGTRSVSNRMKFTYYGHACFAVTAGGSRLLFDPFISPNPLAEKIDVQKVEADFILVSHGHGDHVADVVEIAKRTGAMVIAPFEVGSWFEKKGVTNVQSMNHGGAVKLSFGRVKLTAAVHSSSMPDGS